MNCSLLLPGRSLGAVSSSNSLYLPSMILPAAKTTTSCHLPSDHSTVTFHLIQMIHATFHKSLWLLHKDIRRKSTHHYHSRLKYPSGYRLSQLRSDIEQKSLGSLAQVWLLLLKLSHVSEMWEREKNPNKTKQKFNLVATFFSFNNMHSLLKMSKR